MRSRNPRSHVQIDAVTTAQESDSVKNIQLNKVSATIPGRIHEAPGDKAVLYVFGAGGGLGGPAGGVYERLATQFQPQGITSLQLDYRRPGYFEDCVDDVLSGVEYL